MRAIAFKGVTLGAVQGGAIPLVAQAVQMTGPEHYRTEFDWNDIGLGVVSGAAAGAAGEFFGVRTMMGLERRFANNTTSAARSRLHQVGIRFVGAGVGGAAGAVAGVVSVVPFTGRLDLGWDHLLPGMVGGVLGSMPHALRGPAGPEIGAPVGDVGRPVGDGPGAGDRTSASPGDDGPPPSSPPRDEGGAADRPGADRDDGASGGRDDDSSDTSAQPGDEGDSPGAVRTEADGRTEGEARPETAARPEGQPRPDTEVRHDDGARPQPPEETEETGGPRTEERPASRGEPGTDTPAPAHRDETVPVRSEDETQPETVAQPEHEGGASRSESVAQPEHEGGPGSEVRPESVVRPEGEPRPDTEVRSEDGVRPRPHEETEGTGSHRTDEETHTTRGENDTATPVPARGDEVVSPRGRDREATPPSVREGERTPPRGRDSGTAPPRGRGGEITAPRGREAEAAAAHRGLDETTTRNEADETTPREADEASARRHADEEETARRAAEEEEAARREEEEDPPTVPLRRTGLSDEEAARIAAGEEPGALRVEGDWTQREFIPPLDGVSRRTYTKDQIVEMWENKIGRKMTLNEIRTLELGCVGISSMFAGHPLHPPNNLMFSDPDSYPRQFEYEKILAPLDRLNSDMDNARNSLREVQAALRRAEKEHRLNPGSTEVHELRKSVKAWEEYINQIREAGRKAAAKLSDDISMLDYEREMAMREHGFNTQELVQHYKQRFEDILRRQPATREEFMQMVAEDSQLSKLRNVEQYLPSGQPSEWDVVMYAKHFYSGQEHVRDAAGNPLYHNNGWPVSRSTDPNPDLFKPDPETGQVDMSGDLCCPKGPGMGNFDFGLYLEDIDAWVNANHMEYPNPVRRKKDPMRAFVKSSMDFHSYGGYYDSAVIGLAFRRIVP
ncbi:hypothetical protein [Nocardia brevicatena]|uniref:hypothetical protein n=1 Tax=Nocardia brevicatena TaxID=37327 RepID=UPI001C3F4E04|nr:hypothetical protein [Nocardia brevicatena]